MKATILLRKPKATAKLGVFSMLISLLVLPGVVEGRLPASEQRKRGPLQHK